MLQKIPFPHDLRQRQVLFVIYIVFIAALSLFPADSSELPVKHIDKVGHFTAYVLMAVLALVSFRRRNGQIAAVAACIVIAVLLEWGQRFSPGRLVTLTDGITNILGLATGVLIYWWYFREAKNQ